MCRAVLVFALLLAGCAATPGPGPNALAEGALPIVVDGATYGYRHVAAEPNSFMAVITPGDVIDLPTSPALRISGTDDPRLANRVMGTLCGIEPAAAESYGDFGDPVGRDDETGEFIYWLDCRSGTSAD